MAGTSQYPTSLDTFATDKADATVTATDHPQHHNDLADAINKVEAELGTDPSGTEASVKARLAALDITVAGKAATNAAAGGVLSGTYPNPTFAVDMATQAELDAEASARATAEALLAPKASPTLTGTVTVPDQSAGDNSTKAANTKYVDTASGLLVPKSILTAKGSIITATGSATPVERTVGANGSRIVANSNNSDGLGWALDTPFLYRSGVYYRPPIYAGSAAAAPVQGRLYAVPFPVARRTAFDRIGVHITTAATSGGKLRFVIYNDDGNGYPGTMFADLGQMAADAGTGATELTINQTLDPGLYWLTVAEQVSNSVQVHTYSTGSGAAAHGGPIVGWASAAVGTVLFGYQITGVTGSPPDPYTASAARNNTPVISVRAT